MKKCFKKVISLLIVIALVGCSSKSGTATASNVSSAKPYSYAFAAFDTTCSISLYGVENEYVGKNIVDNLKLVIDAYEGALSRTRVGSDIYEINHRTGDSVMITDITANIFDVAKGMYEWSDNKFDISAGTLVELWDVKNRTTIPLVSEINEAKSHCGNFDYTITKDVDPENIKSHKITFTGDRKTVYDVGALGKGYCCDSLKAMLQEEPNVKAAIINLGGNVTCVGKLDGRKGGAFNVGIFKPFSGNDIIDTVKVVDKNVITSGTYQRYFKIDGDNRIYHHIIDPINGIPVDNELNSVSIISENGMLGDYLSTACMLLGTKRSEKLIDFCKKNFKDKNIQAIFVDKDNNVTKYPKKVQTY